MRPFLIVASSLLVLEATALALPQAPVHALSDGIYTEAQALRGKTAYRQHCTYCHHDDLLGGEDLEVIPPALVSAAFDEQWLGKTVGEMFVSISTTMPWRGTALLPQVYADIIGYLLQENGYPAGDTELPANPVVLSGTRITPRK